MLTVSDAFKAQLENDNRKYLHKIDFTLADGTALQVTNDDLWSGSPKFSKATSGDGNFDVGAFVIGKFNFILNDMYGRFGDTYNFNLATVDYQIGLALPSGNTEYVRIGRYVVDEVDYDGYLISIECLDYAYYFEKPWATTLSFPTTAGAIIQEACTRCGITLATSSWDGYNIPVNAKPQDKNLTWLSAIGYAAQICGQYAKMDNLGRLVIGWYDIDNLSQVTVDGAILDSTDAKILDHADDPIIGSLLGATDDAWNALPTSKKSKYARLNHISSVKVGHYPILITGVKCTVRNGDNDVEYVTGTNEYVIDVTGNPFIGNGNVNTVITRIAENTVGYYFYTFEASYLSRPYYDAGDLAWVEDYRNGRVYCSFITNMTFSSGQYQESSCGAETPAKKQAATYSPAMKILAEAGRSVRASLDSYENVAKQMTELISLGYGMHFSEEKQPDGSSIFYLHDKATVEESDNVWKLTSTGLVVSKDGGTTWAIDENGNALYNVLTARGINADWIKSGKIEIKDNGGNTIFLADITNKIVSIGGLEQRIDEAELTANAALSAVDNKLFVVLSDDYKTIVTASDGSYSTFPECKTYYRVYFNGVDITESNDVQLQVFLKTGTPMQYDYGPDYYMEITGLPDMDDSFLALRATYKGYVAEKRYYVYKRKVGGSTNYGIDVTALRSVIGNELAYTPDIITASAYSTTDNGTTKTDYSGGRIHVSVCVGEDTWYDDVLINSGASSETVKMVRTTDKTPTWQSGYEYDTLKLPLDSTLVRFSLYDGDTLLDRQDVTLLVASLYDEAVAGAEKSILRASDSQQKIFNALTNNRADQGLYLQNGRLYINASYIASGAIEIGKMVDVEGTPTYVTTFYANASTGEVEINADTIKIAGTNVVDKSVEEAEDSILNSVDSQDKIFDALIGGDNQQGIILDNGKLYINSTYIKTGTLKVGGSGNGNGIISLRDSSNAEYGSITNGGISLRRASDYAANTKYGVDIYTTGLQFYRDSSSFGGVTVFESQVWSDSSNDWVYSHMGLNIQSQEINVRAQDGRELNLGFYDWNGNPIDGLTLTRYMASFGGDVKVYANEFHASNGYSGYVNGMHFVDGILVSVS